MPKSSSTTGPRGIAGVLFTVIVLACSPQTPEVREPAAPTADPPPPATVTRVERPPASPPPTTPEPLALRFVSPNIGPTTGGNDVTIDGRGFADYPQVTFGGQHAWIRSVTPTEIRVTVPAPARQVPAGDTLVVDVTIANPPEGNEGSASQTLARSYSYVSASPPPDPPAPATVAPATVAPATVTEPPPADNTPASADPPTAVADAVQTPPAEPATVGPSSLVASFDFEMLQEAEGCPPPGTAVRFTDRSSGDVTEWWWDFGDGATSKARHNDHCYSAPGMRSVSLTVSNDDESASTSKIVTAGM